MIDWTNLDDLIALSVVYFGLNEAEFLEYTPLEFNKLLEIKQNERTNDWKLDMERMRMQTFYLLNIQIEKKNRFKSVGSMMPFEWDVKDKQAVDDTREPTEEEWEHYDTIGASGIKKKE